jgi:hypothetical protein
MAHLWYTKSANQKYTPAITRLASWGTKRSNRRHARARRGTERRQAEAAAAAAATAKATRERAEEQKRRQAEAAAAAKAREEAPRRRLVSSVPPRNRSAVRPKLMQRQRP